MLPLIINGHDGISAREHPKERVCFSSGLLSSACVCYWNAHAPTKAVRGDYASASNPRSACQAIRLHGYLLLSIALYIRRVSKPAKTCNGRSESCTLDLQPLRLTVNEYCGAARNSPGPVVADSRCCFAGTLMRAMLQRFEGMVHVEHEFRVALCCFERPSA